VSPRRIAILGGGAAALTAAYGLSERADALERFDITVYQQGWRLGGKGASSRNVAARWRNEEHGLHVLGGFYHNAFALLRDCYGAWALADPGRPGQDFDQVFMPQPYCTLQETDGAGGWRAVDLVLPTDPRKPGVDPTELSIGAAVRRVLQFIRDRALAAIGMAPPSLTLQAHLLASVDDARTIARLASEALNLSDQVLAHPVGPGPFGLFGFDDAARMLMITALRSLRDVLLAADVSWIPTGRAPNEAQIGAVATICILGIVEDKLFQVGFDTINDQELAAWLRTHGANDRILDCAYVRAGFDYAFAYAGGQTNPPRRSIAAGVALRAFLRLLLTYHGALFFHMQGGMGEAVFAPLHEVLAARGVKFRFFHRVESLRLNAAGDQVEEIGIRIQATPTAGPDAYQPLVVDPNGHKVWPAAPLYDQLEDGANLSALGDDLESAWAPDRGAPRIVLQRGGQFDDVILGISVGALPDITADLRARKPRWAEMLASAATVPVAGVQLWSRRTAAEMGCPPPAALVTAYAQPFATWCDMSFLLAREVAANPPLRHLAYVCGPLPPQAPQGGVNFPRAQADRVAAASDSWLDHALAHLMPGAMSAGAVAADFGVERYIRANASPSDHYVLSPPGSISKRLKPDASGVGNLYLAGDWTKNGLDAGAFEAAVMSGRQCARALTGGGPRVYGETDLS
jgi:uncharacterized protein with NAD-binding domain and iron-sulfur cluster